MNRLLRALATFHAQFWQGTGAAPPPPPSSQPAGGGSAPDRRTLAQQELGIRNALARVRAQSLPLRAREESLLRELAWVRARRGDPPRVGTRTPLAASVAPAAPGRGRRLPGTSRPELVRVIAVRERRLLPVVRDTLRRIQAAVPSTELRRAWVQGGQHPGLERIVTHIWQDAKPRLVAALVAPLMKQIDQTRAEDLADRLIGALIVDLSERQRAAVRTQLAVLMDQGPTPAVLGAIGAAAGLTVTQTHAVANFIAARLDEGLPEEQAQRAGEVYATRLQAQRAQTIARTEAVMFTNHLVLEQGRSVGGRVVKRWVSARDGNVDAICQTLDDDEGVAIDAPFTAGGFSFDGPPAHPNCRCLVELWREDA